MRIFSKAAKEENQSVSDLISEQRQKESIEVWRRGWCITQATMVTEDCSAQELIRMAEEIYKYVYGSELES